MITTVAKFEEAQRQALEDARGMAASFERLGVDLDEFIQLIEAAGDPPAGIDWIIAD